MSSFLLEILSEEIPARMQLDAAANFKKIAEEIFVKQNINFEKNHLRTFITPRRLTLYLEEISALQKTPEVKKRGPKIGADERALSGFLKSLNLKDVNELEQINIDGVDYYSYTKSAQELKTKDLIVEAIPLILNKMVNSWSKIMRWDQENSVIQPKWVRPIRNICALFDDEIVNFEYAGLKSNNLTFGHFLFKFEPLTIRNSQQYEEILEKNFVIVDQVKRKEKIVAQIKKITKESNLQTIDNLESGLIDEVCGLCENPTALIGKIEQKFMSLPPEILVLTIKLNQKYFCLSSNNKIVDCFIFVSNAIINEQNSAKIIADNERVVKARLSDAKFFIEEDLKIPFISRLEELKNIVFHQRLGSVFDKVKRLEYLAEYLALWVPRSEISLIARMTKLCKNDLVTKAVAELPELQGKVGGYYASMQNENEKIAAAIYEHYLPLGANSELPKTALGVLLSIADKIDSIVGLFLADEKPTASKDPYALRRSALGVIRTSIANNIDLPIKIVVEKSIHFYPVKIIKNHLKEDKDLRSKRSLMVEEIVRFVIERFRVYLRENEGFRADIINAVIDDYFSDFKKQKYFSLLKIYNKIKFLDNFVRNQSNQKIIELYKRSVNIVNIAQKEEKVVYKGRISLLALKSEYEKNLYRAIKKIKVDYKKLVKNENYAEAFKLLLSLQEPITQFFDNLQVNDKNENIRKNRLLILAKIKAMFGKVADFSKIEIS